MRAFAIRNQKSIDCSSECSSEFLHVPSNSKDLSQASQQGATIHLSPDVPAKSEEQNLVSEINSTTTISSVNPTASNQPSNIMATMKQSGQKVDVESHSHHVTHRKNHMDSTSKMPATKIEREKRNGWTNADIMKEHCCFKPLTSTPLPIAKNCMSTASSKQKNVNRASELIDSVNQCQLSFISEHKPSVPEPCLESTNFSVKNTEAPVAEGHPDKLQPQVEPCSEFPSARGKSELSMLNVSAEAEDEDESIYFTPELYDDIESEEQKIGPLVPTCNTDENRIECQNSTVTDDLFAINTSETLSVTKKMIDDDDGRSTSLHGIMQNEGSENSAVHNVEMTSEIEAEQIASQEMDTKKQKISLSRSRNKGVSSFLLNNTST